MSHDLHRLLTKSDIHPPVDSEGRVVSSLAYDSRKVEKDALFFALPGEKSDGSDFARQAAEQGATGVVAATDIADLSIPVARVPDARAAMADVAKTYYDDPAASLKAIAITGTNGKTTTAFLVKHIADSVLHRCGLIGTVRTVVGDREFDSVRTTPESPDVQSLLREMVDVGSRAVTMEVSSHALVQHRTRGIDWDAAIFTNLTQDHLDYHKTMEAYFDAKASLFEGVYVQTAKRGKSVINTDDRYGRFLVERLPKNAKPLTYGLGVHPAFRASNVRFDFAGTQFQLTARDREYLVRTPLIGMFNVYNSLAALTAAAAVGIEIRRAIAALATVPQIPGRLERVPAKRNFQVFVDYAHTDDALTNVLRTLRDLRPRRLVVVFGCGGDRDRAKRPLMGRAAAQIADYSIVTSDNPRSEDPERILADIVTGMREGTHETVVDRADAITRAINLAEQGDIILIAGKGHETYQEFENGRRVNFDDVSTARNAIAAKPTVTDEDR
ncbi:MAG: UDP-N-acetylmuramoyl-L-alanyl-D-glutamate--2,6-diaminopimelate ligase [Chthoniobacterales bacterium]